MAAKLPEGDPPDPTGALPPGIEVVATTPLSAYVHVPYCTVRCGYCDFNTYTATELRGSRREDYVDVLSREIALAQRVLAAAGPERALDTIFIGGGTPTLLPASDLLSVVERLDDTFGLTDNVEITVEANPDTLSDAYCVTLAQAGVTRVSVGMQSAVAHVLTSLDRTHDAERMPEVIDAIRSAGMRPSIDLIYGTPGESLADWRDSIEAAINLGVDHVSAYALIVEEGTALERKISRRDIEPVDDDVQADMYELADSLLTQAGLSWYEISNWARSEDDRSRHNLAYWRNRDWWGFGPGAHSHIGGLRFWNVRHPAAYQQRLIEGLSPVHSQEIPDDGQRLLEEVLLGVRTREGLPTERLSPIVVAELASDGLINDEAARAGQLVLTLPGRLRADEVTRRLTA